MIDFYLLHIQKIKKLVIFNSKNYSDKEIIKLNLQNYL